MVHWYTLYLWYIIKIFQSLVSQLHDHLLPLHRWHHPLSPLTSRHYPTLALPLLPLLPTALSVGNGMWSDRTKKATIVSMFLTIIQRNKTTREERSNTYRYSKVQYFNSWDIETSGPNLCIHFYVMKWNLRLAQHPFL